MRVDVRMMNVPGSRALESYVRRRVGNALERLSHRVRGSLVRIWDENGPRGGVDMHCQIIVALHPRGEVIVSEVSEDIYRTIDQVIPKLKKSVVRGIERRCDLRGRKGDRRERGGLAA